MHSATFPTEKGSVPNFSNSGGFKLPTEEAGLADLLLRVRRHFRADADRAGGRRALCSPKWMGWHRLGLHIEIP